MSGWRKMLGGLWFSLIIAMSLDILALPASLIPFRPDWVALTVIYWSMALPQRFSLVSAWIAGLLLDELTGTLLGQHALALTILAYISIHFYQRMRTYPLWQQALGVGLMLIVYRLLMLWIYGISGHPPHTWTYWPPLLTDILIWPWVYLLLRGMRRRLQPLR